MIRTTIVTTGMIRQIFPRAPSTRIIGENVTMVVRTANITGVATWYVPLNAASDLPSPRCLNMKIFSPTIIASSTTIPKTKIKVNREIMLMDTSNNGNNQKPPMNDIGIPSDIQPANFGFRNNANTKITKDNPR